MYILGQCWIRIRFDEGWFTCCRKQIGRSLGDSDVQRRFSPEFPCSRKRNSRFIDDSVRWWQSSLATAFIGNTVLLIKNFRSLSGIYRCVPDKKSWRNGGCAYPCKAIVMISLFVSSFWPFFKTADLKSWLCRGNLSGFQCRIGKIPEFRGLVHMRQIAHEVRCPKCTKENLTTCRNCMKTRYLAYQNFGPKCENFLQKMFVFQKKLLPLHPNNWGRLCPTSWFSIS